MAKEYIITGEVSKALDTLDWNALAEHHITRADVEANPQAACQLAEGRATTVRVEYSIPGIPEKQEAQLITRKYVDQETGERVLSPEVIVKKIDRSYELTPDNIVISGLYDSNGRSYRLDPSKPDEKAIIGHLLPKTEKARNGEERTYTCSICPIPLKVSYKSGKEVTCYLGWDTTSNRPVHRSAESLRAMLLTEDGHSRLREPLFGKGITVDDAMAAAMAEGKTVAAFGESNGKRFATALSFNIARGQVTEDHSKVAEGIRQSAYEYLRRQQGVKAAPETAPKRETAVKTSAAPAVEPQRKRGPRKTI